MLAAYHPITIPSISDAPGAWAVGGLIVLAVVGGPLLLVWLVRRKR